MMDTSTVDKRNMVSNIMDTSTVDNMNMVSSIMDTSTGDTKKDECTGYRDTCSTDRATYSGHKDVCPGQSVCPVVDKDISISKQVRSAVTTLWKQFTQGNYLAITNRFWISFR